MNPQQLASLTLKLDRARWWAMGNQPFYGTLAMGLQDVIGNPHGETACTDGKRIYWTPEFLAKLTDEETRFVLLHETMHPAHGHLWRLPPTERGNQAGDYAINATLAKLPGLKMPAGGLLDPAFGGMAEEEILNRLPEPPPGGGGSGQGSACGDFCEPAPDGEGQGAPGNGQNQGKPGQGQDKTPPGQQNPVKGPQNALNESLQDQWKERVIQAAQAAKALGKGDCPADMQRIIDRTLSQKVDWRREMADFVKERISTRNDWSRSARRHASQPVIYARKRADETGLIIACRDVSGSVDDKTLAEFTGLIADCLGDSNCSAIVIDVDAAIHAESRVDPGEEVPCKTVGGGGTDFNCIQTRIRDILESGERLAGVVFCTDLAATLPDDFCDLPTLWLSTTDSIAPFGRTVKIEA